MTASVSPALKAFLEGGVAIIAASRDAQNRPSIARGGGCRVESDGRVTVFVAAEQSARCIEDVRATGAIAILCVEPHTYECYQIKGASGRVATLDEQERRQVVAYRRAFFANLLSVGVAETVATGLLPAEPEGFVSIAFTPTEIFCNTPGPAVGTNENRPS